MRYRETFGIKLLLETEFQQGSRYPDLFFISFLVKGGENPFDEPRNWKKPKKFKNPWKTKERNEQGKYYSISWWFEMLKCLMATKTLTEVWAYWKSSGLIWWSSRGKLLLLSDLNWNLHHFLFWKRLWQEAMSREMKSWLHLSGSQQLCETSQPFLLRLSRHSNKSLFICLELSRGF